jgi:DNA repair protein RadC
MTREIKTETVDAVPVVGTRLVREAEAPWPRCQLSSPEAVAAFFREYFRDQCQEEFWLVLLSTANTVEAVSRLSVGGLAASIVEPRAVFRTAILANAAAVICVHNHPSGAVEPSREDVRMTRQLVEAGHLMGIPVHDHVIVTGEGYTSMVERGLLGA